MSKTEPAAAAASAPETKAEAPREPVVRVGKDAIYERLGNKIKEMTGKRVGLSGGREVFDAVVEEIFVEATKEGSFRFNGGFGSLHIKTYQAGERRLPSGQTTTFGERQKLRYEEGVVVAGLVEHKGDLTKVQALRKEAAGAAETAPAGKAEGEVSLA
jgi:hypothetical protein